MELIHNNAKRAKTILVLFWIALPLEALNSFAKLTRDETLMDTILFIYTAFDLIIIVYFLMWFHRAYANLHRLEIKELRHTSGTAVVGFIIPLINFFRPFIILREIVNFTQVKIVEKNPDFQSRSLMLASIAWWGLFLSTGFVAIAFYEVKDFSGLIIEATLNVCAILATINLIYEVSKLEAEMYRLYK